jgi:hypothetical protein
VAVIGAAKRKVVVAEKAKDAAQEELFQERAGSR